MDTRKPNRYVQVTPHTVVEITPELMEEIEKARRRSVKKFFLYGVVIPLAILSATALACILLRLS